MNIQQIIDTIYDLEKAPTTFQNCINLAALYTVRDHAINASTGYQAASQDRVENELSDILPSYRVYVDKKRLYQHEKSNKDSLISANKRLCYEIHEFLFALYSNTEIPESRQLIKEMLQGILNDLS